jgi:hypothetical protein
MDPEELIRKILEARDRVAPLLPDIDPGDLTLILEMLLRPVGSGRIFFIREANAGSYVF